MANVSYGWNADIFREEYLDGGRCEDSTTAFSSWNSKTLLNFAV